MFWEFVQFVIASPIHVMDEHWIPMHYYCSICSTDFDYIVKFENDEEILLQKALWPPNVPFPHQEEAEMQNSNSLGLKSEEITQKYFCHSLHGGG